MTPGQYVDRVRAIRSRLDADCEQAATAARERVLQRAREKVAALLERVPDVDRYAAQALVDALPSDAYMDSES